MVRAVVVGGGWSGCAAAVAARKAGAEVALLERTDMLLGTGLVGGIMRNNGRFTAAEEMKAMGAGELFEICDRCSRHKGVEFPGHRHASLYDIARTQGETSEFVSGLGIEVFFNTRIVHAEVGNGVLLNISDKDGNTFYGDVFIDATGTAGPTGNCTKYGNGCAMCIMRCPSFGGRLSLAGLAGIKETDGCRADGTPGAMSGSCKLFRESLSREIKERLDKCGVAVIPIPSGLMKDHLGIKACQQYATEEYRENIVLLDTGHAKLMAPFFDLESLRRIPGLEYARFEDPYSGGIGNSVRFFNMAPRDDAMKVEGIANLFCAGEKAGLLVGHTEAIITGTLAGYNSVRHAEGKELLVLPRELAAGDAIAYVREQMQTGEGLKRKYTFSGSVYFERMKKLGLYTTDAAEINRRVEKTGMGGIFAPMRIPVLQD